MKKRICLYGGTFDPPHVGHVAVAQVACEQWKADQVLFVPTGQSPHKEGEDVSVSEARLAMVECALHAYPQFSVTRLELDRPGPSYTVDTILSFHNQFPDAELGFLLGADMLADFCRWERAGDIAALVELVVAPRPHYDLQKICHEVQETLAHARIASLQMPALDISSSWLRERLISGLRSEMLLPTGVAAYIDREGLYKT